jgi:hypothetical protein
MSQAILRVSANMIAKIVMSMNDSNKRPRMFIVTKNALPHDAKICYSFASNGIVSIVLEHDSFQPCVLEEPIPDLPVPELKLVHAVNSLAAPAPNTAPDTIADLKKERDELREQLATAERFARTGRESPDGHSATYRAVRDLVIKIEELQAKLTKAEGRQRKS